MSAEEGGGARADRTSRDRPASYPRITLLRHILDDVTAT